MTRLRFFLLSFLLATPAFSRDVFVVGVDGRGADINPCVWLHWSGDVLFHNAADTVQNVRVLDVSNAPLSALRDNLDVPPKTVVSLQSAVANTWNPLSGAEFIPLWVWRFSVPDAVKVMSYMELREENCALSLVGFGAVRGQITLPTFDRLVPAGEEQVFLGTDLGDLDRRVNVAIYNAGEVSASAQVTVRRICDNATLASETISLPPDTTLQRVRLHSGRVALGECGPEHPTRGTYVTVRLDQPGLAFVSALGNDEITRLSYNLVGE